MDEITFLGFFKNIILFVGILGALAGLDLLSGAKIIYNSKKILDRVFDFDKIIIRASSLVRKTLDAFINFDETIIKTKTRIILGILFLFFSIFMILLAGRG